MPDSLVQTLQLAVEHHSAGRLREAEKLYRDILSQDANHPGALHLLGVIAHQAGHNAPAIDLIRRALRVFPDYAEAYGNLGKILADEGELGLAIACCERAISLKPDHASAYNILGVALRALDRRAEAAAVFQRAIDVDPNNTDALINLGDSAAENAEPDAAESLYRRALTIRPDLFKAHHELGNVLKEKGRLDDALREFRQSLLIAPQSRAAHSNLIYTLHFHPDFDAAAIRAEQNRWHAQHAQRFSPAAHRNSRDPARRLKIGYVSPHFSNHAEAYFVAPLLEAHDRKQFEVHCYSSVARPDELTARMQKAANHWHQVLGMTDDALAEKIRADGIDILIDLTMHMAGERLLTFAQKPAPVQVCWLAYPGSTGQPFMDYRLTDAFMDPPDADDSWASERTARLSDSWCCFDPLGALPLLAPPPVVTNGFLTFGSLNNFCKVNEDVLALWARVLAEIENSRLILMCPPGESRQRVHEFFASRNIDRSRVEFVYYLPRKEYLELYQRIDIALDPFPYNGITTTCDALLMGVPVLTLPGVRPASRAGLSLLSTVMLADTIAQNEDHFVQLAKDFAENPNRLAEIRKTLREKTQSSPLMDAPQFARNVETAYRQMWREWCDAQRA